MKTKYINGFTLIELLITVAVVGILTSIALPSYSRYIARGKITDAMAALADYSVKMEQYFQDNRNYGSANTACPVTAANSLYFVYSCQVGATTPSDSYIATASSIAGALGTTAADYRYTINQSNAKTSNRFEGATLSKNCWLVKGNEC
ncbi:type IV pilin protein [Polaromonas vacuolata]|nr:type IV pilin protein [Polaromonas vacuolata]